MDRNQLTKCVEDDPNRCQAVAKTGGQCVALSTDDSDFCIAHGGNKAAESKKKDDLRNYRLTKFQSLLQRHASSPHIKSLRDEIGILRMSLEERLNQCNDAHDLILQSGPISDMVMKIDKVVSSCHKLEGSMGQLLDKQSILQFATELINIISSILEGQEDKINEIADEILALVGRIGEKDA